MLGFPYSSADKEFACSKGDPVGFLGWEDPLEEEIATHSSILAWEISWTEKPGGYSSWGHKEIQPKQLSVHTLLYLVFVLPSLFR